MVWVPLWPLLLILTIKSYDRNPAAAQKRSKIEQIKRTIMHVLLLTALLIHHLQFPLMPVW